MIRGDRGRTEREGGGDVANGDAAGTSEVDRAPTDRGAEGSRLADDQSAATREAQSTGQGSEASAGAIEGQRIPAAGDGSADRERARAVIRPALRAVQRYGRTDRDRAGSPVDGDPSVERDRVGGTGRSQGVGAGEGI